MRTTMNLDDELIERAQELTGIKERNTLVRMDPEALIAHESVIRLMRLGGTDPYLEDMPCAVIRQSLVIKNRGQFRWV